MPTPPRQSARSTSRSHSRPPSAKSSARRAPATPDKPARKYGTPLVAFHSGALRPALEARTLPVVPITRSFGSIAHRDLARYYALLARTASTLPHFSLPQAQLIAAALAGARLDDGEMLPIVLWSRVDEAARDERVLRQAALGPGAAQSLVEALRRLTACECVAVVDAVECAALLVERGEAQSQDGALRRVGLVKDSAQ